MTAPSSYWPTALLCAIMLSGSGAAAAQEAPTAEDVLARFEATLEVLRSSGDDAAVASFLEFAFTGRPDLADAMRAKAAAVIGADSLAALTADTTGDAPPADATAGAEGAAIAQSTPPENDVIERGLLRNWSGEARVGGALLTGNTDSRVATFGFEGRKETPRWTFDLASSGRFERRGGESVADRIAGSLDAGRLLSDRWRLVSYARGERDRFSGFDYRATAGVGAEWAVLVGDKFTWSLLAGPGVRFDGADVERINPDGSITRTTDLRVEPIVRGSSDLDWAITDRISFVQDIDVLAGETSQVDVTSAFDVDLIGRLSLRIGNVIRARPSPPAGAEPVDTESVVELKYEFGG